MFNESMSQTIGDEIGPNEETAQEMSQETSVRLKEKIWTAWGLARKIIAAQAEEEYGAVANLYLTGQILYDALFSPNHLSPEYLALADPDDQELLLAPLSTSGVLPSRQEFVDDFRNAMVNEVDFREAYFPGAVEAVETMLQYGPVRIWTTGDVYGVPSLDLPGSHEQGKRLYYGGWFELMEKHPQLGLIAHEDKVAELDAALRDFHEQSVNTIVVIDDKVSNLLSAQRRIVARVPDVTVVLVWDRQYEGAAGNGTKHSNPKLPKGFEGTPEEASEQFGLVMVYSLEEGVMRVTEMLGGAEDGDRSRPGFLVDHDDVISNDKMRTRLQEEAVLAWIQGEGWVS